jgi:hypothetical protein
MKRTNHKPVLRAVIGSFVIACGAIPASVAMFKAAYADVSDPHFALLFFISCCLGLLGIVTALGATAGFCDWAQLYIASLEERSNVQDEPHVQIIYVRHGNTYVPVRLSDDEVIPVNRRLR